MVTSKKKVVSKKPTARKTAVAKQPAQPKVDIAAKLEEFLWHLTSITEKMHANEGCSHKHTENWFVKVGLHVSFDAEGNAIPSDASKTHFSAKNVSAHTIAKTFLSTITTLVRDTADKSPAPDAIRKRMLMVIVSWLNKQLLELVDMPEEVRDEIRDMLNKD